MLKLIFHKFDLLCYLHQLDITCQHVYMNSSGPCISWKKHIIKSEVNNAMILFRWKRHIWRYNTWIKLLHIEMPSYIELLYVFNFWSAVLVWKLYVNNIFHKSFFWMLSERVYSSFEKKKNRKKLSQ